MLRKRKQNGQARMLLGRAWKQRLAHVKEDAEPKYFFAKASFLPAHHTMPDAEGERCGLEVEAHLHRGIQRTSSLLEAYGLWCQALDPEANPEVDVASGRVFANLGRSCTG